MIPPNAGRGGWAVRLTGRASLAFDPAEEGGFVRRAGRLLGYCEGP